MISIVPQITYLKRSTFKIKFQALSRDFNVIHHTYNRNHSIRMQNRSNKVRASSSAEASVDPTTSVCCKSLLVPLLLHVLTVFGTLPHPLFRYTYYMNMFFLNNRETSATGALTPADDMLSFMIFACVSHMVSSSDLVVSSPCFLVEEILPW